MFKASDTRTTSHHQGRRYTLFRKWGIYLVVRFPTDDSRRVGAIDLIIQPLIGVAVADLFSLKAKTLAVLQNRTRRKENRSCSTAVTHALQSGVKL